MSQCSDCMDYKKINKEAWDRRVNVHVESKFYDVEGFLDGNTSLREIELAEVGDVKDKRLLHLQCHFGLDTLSLARMGAIVTGVDISPVAIEKANELKQQLGLDAHFVCSDVYEFGASVKETYDMAFTSYGAINWLPDLDLWAETISRSLKPDGKFYMVEFHPAFDLASGYSYFSSNEPDVEEEGSYTENASDEVSTMVTWPHPICEVLNALISTGIKIEQFNEFPFSPYNCFAGLKEKEKGRYYAADSKHDVPLVYSISGIKIR